MTPGPLRLRRLILAALFVAAAPLAAQDDEGERRERRSLEQAERFYARHGTPDLRGVQRRAVESRERERDLERRAAGDRRRLGVASLAVPAFTPLGPAYVPAAADPIGSAQPGQDDSGLVTAIAAHPTDPRTLVVGSAGGGLWKTTDGGATWRAVADNLPAGGLSIGAVAYAPSDPTRVYAGSACGDSSSIKVGRWLDTVVKTGIGFLVSRDGGESWSPLPNPPGSYFWAILVDPSNADRLLAACDTGISRSTDAGATWTSVLAGAGGGRLPVASLSRSPSAPNVVYAGAISQGGTPDVVFKSTDAGGTWTSVSAGLPGRPDTRGRAQVATGPSDPNRVYVLLSDGEGLGRQVDLAVSTDGGATWRPSNLLAAGTDILGTQGIVDNALAVDPAGANTVWAGGMDLWRSTDAGATFARVSDWSPVTAGATLPYLHADQHAIVFGADGTMYLGTDGGIFRASGSGFVSMNKGITSWLVDELCVSADGSVVMNGAQDNGTSLRVSGTDWLQVQSGDGFGCLVSPTNPKMLTISVYNQQISVSTDGGSTFAGATGLSVAGSGQSTWRTQLVPHPTIANRAFTFSKDKIWRSDDGGATWTQSSQAMPLLDTIVDLAIGPDGNRMLLADSQGVVAESLDGGATWTRRGQVPVKVSAVRPDRTNPQGIFVASDVLDVQKERVWVSPDDGATWTPISRTNQDGGLPDLPLYVLEQDPVTATVLWAGVYSGLYRSGDGGQSWSRYGDGLPNVPVSAIRFPADGSSVFVGTSGRGVWQAANVPVSAAALAGPLAAKPPVAAFIFAPAKPRPGQEVDFADGSAFMTSWAWDFGDGGSSREVNPAHVFAQAGSYTVTLTVTGGGGTSTKRAVVTVAPANTGTGATLTYLLPVIVRAAGQGGTNFGTELTLTNRTGQPLALSLTASTIPGTVSYTLPPGQQLFPDVFAFLAAHGLAVPSGTVVTPLRIAVDGAPGLGFFGAQVRVTTPPNDALRAQGVIGRFGLAFTATPLTFGAVREAYLYGLQQTSSPGQPGARANLACLNAGSGSNGTIGLEVTYWDGDAGTEDQKRDTMTLAPFQLQQLSAPLASRGIAHGFARIRRTAGDDQFVCYATVLDNVSGDSAFVPMSPTDTDSAASEAMVPVVLDAAGYKSELTLANRSLQTLAGTLALVPAGGGEPQYGDIEMAPLEEVSIADIMGTLRSAGFDVPPGTVASLRFAFAPSETNAGNRPGVALDSGEVPTSDVGVSVRTYATRAGGLFGLAYPATPVGAAADTEAWVFGLQQSGTRGQEGGTRSNLAVVHALGGAVEPLTLELTWYDDSGRELGRQQVTLAPGQWSQINAPLAAYPSVTSGYARIRRIAGSDQFIAYGVLNDQGNDDGSFVPMTVP